MSGQIWIRVRFTKKDIVERAGNTTRINHPSSLAFPTFATQSYLILLSDKLKSCSIQKKGFEGDDIKKYAFLLERKHRKTMLGFSKKVDKKEF